MFCVLESDFKNSSVFPSKSCDCSLSSPFLSLKLTEKLFENLRFCINLTSLFKRKVWVFLFSPTYSWFELYFLESVCVVLVWVFEWICAFGIIVLNMGVWFCDDTVRLLWVCSFCISYVSSFDYCSHTQPLSCLDPKSQIFRVLLLNAHNLFLTLLILGSIVSVGCCFVYNP